MTNIPTSELRASDRDEELLEYARQLKTFSVDIRKYENLSIILNLK